MKKTIILISLLVSMIFLFNKTTADTRPNTNPIGFEYINSGNNQLLHIWNKFEDYYINSTSGTQFSDKDRSFYTYNIFCAKTPSTSEICTNKTNVFVKYPIKSDNLTYINVTYHENTVPSIFNLTYSLDNKEKNLSIIFAAKSPIAINNIQLKWKIINIKIFGNKENDFILLNNNANKYNLSLAINKNFNNLTSKMYRLMDNADVFMYWNTTPYNLTIKSEANQYNAPVTLILKRNVTANQRLSFKFKWNDPLCNIFAQPNWTISTYCTPLLGNTANGWILITNTGTLNLGSGISARAKNGIVIATGGTALIATGGSLQVGQEPPP